MLEGPNGSDSSPDDFAALQHTIRAPPTDRATLRRMGLESISTATEEVTLVRGDILDASLVEAILSNRALGESGGVAHDAGSRIREPVDSVVHLAALAGVRPSAERSPEYMRVNVEGTTNLLEHVRRADVSHFVFASSSSVYGLSKDVPFSEDDAAASPTSVHGASKPAGEIACQAFQELYGLPVTALRFFTVYGPRRRPDMAIHKFARLMLEGEPVPVYAVPVYGDGSSARDYTYVDDVVEGIVRALKRPGPFQVFNLDSTRPTKLTALIEELGAALNVAPRLERHPDQSGDVPITSADVSRAERALGYHPTVGIKDGIERLVRWFRDQPQTSRKGSS